MKIHIEQVCAIAGDDMSTDEARKRSIASRRQWLRRRGLKPSGATTRTVKRGNRTMHIAAPAWTEKDVRAELARDVPRGLAAASAETRKAVTDASWSASASRPRNGIA